MDLRKFTFCLLGAVFLIMVSLSCSSICSAANVPPGTVLPDFQLKGPDSSQTKAYLGINNEKLFSLSQIKTKLVLLEFLDVYWPVCQKNAPVVNRTYNLFKDDKNLNKDIKIIGIGVGTQPEEMATYKKTFNVEFPLFTDPKKEIQKKLKVEAVPLTVLLDKKGKVLMSHSGVIGDFDAYVSEIKKNMRAQ